MSQSESNYKQISLVTKVPNFVMASPSSFATVEIQKSQVDYGNHEKLGEGAFGFVVKGEYEGRFVAIKIATRLTGSGGDNDTGSELQTMARLRHNNILGLIGFIKEDFQLQLVFDFMENGSLVHYVAKSPVSEETAIKIMHDIACGMGYLHEMDYIHRDLAARNVLLDHQNRAVVADFGLSRFLNMDLTSYYQIHEGKPLPFRWVPKESLPYGGTYGRFSAASDVWSFGVTVWEIWTQGARPYDKLTNERVVMEILNGSNPLKHHRPAGCPPKVIELLNQIFQVDPKLRPKFDKLKVDIGNMVGGCPPQLQAKPPRGARSAFGWLGDLRAVLFERKPRKPVMVVKDQQEGLPSSELDECPYIYDGTDALDNLPHATFEYEVAKEKLHIDFESVLGSGQYGVVYKGTLVTPDMDIVPVAVKTVRPNAPIEQFKALLSELKILARLGRHENISKLVGAYTANIKNREIYVALELYSGTLLQFLRTNAKAFNRLEGPKAALHEYQNVLQSSTVMATEDLLGWAAEIAAGMEFLGQNRIVHIELAARNILLTEGRQAKISDFGLARQLVDGTYVMKTPAPLPWRWMAIESLTQMCFSTESDVWAFGVTCWEIFSLGDNPYESTTTWSWDFVESLKNGSRLPGPAHASELVYNTLLECWHENKEHRPKFGALKQFFLDQQKTCLWIRMRRGEHLKNLESQEAAVLPN